MRSPNRSGAIGRLQNFAVIDIALARVVMRLPRYAHLSPARRDRYAAAAVALRPALRPITCILTTYTATSCLLASALWGFGELAPARCIACDVYTRPFRSGRTSGWSLAGVTIGLFSQNGLPEGSQADVLKASAERAIAR